MSLQHFDCTSRMSRFIYKIIHSLENNNITTLYKIISICIKHYSAEWNRYSCQQQNSVQNHKKENSAVCKEEEKTIVIEYSYSKSIHY